MHRNILRRIKRKAAALATAAVLLLSGTALAAALPTGGTVMSGGADIVTNGNTMTIEQQHGTVLIDWNSFDIGQGYTVDFVKQLAGDVAINNVIGTSVSNINGSLQGNGTIVLLNPNGISFNDHANINVGSLVASTLRAENPEAVNWNAPQGVQLSGDKGAISVSSLAQLNANKKEGFVVLLAAERVENAGKITAQGGIVTAAGKEMTVAYDTAGKINIGLQTGGEKSGVLNSGSLAGGYVVMTAKTANATLSNLVCNTGTIEARGIREAADGTIELVAANSALNQSGTLTTQGGNITTEGTMVNVMDTARVHAQGGTWSINSTGRSIVVEKGVSQFQGTEIKEINKYGQTATETVGAGSIAQLEKNGMSTPVNTASVVSVAAINNSLSDTNVNITADASGSTVTDIYLEQKISKTSGSGETTFSAQANRNVVLRQGVESTAGALNVELESDKLTNKTAQAGSNLILGDIKTNGGSFKTKAATYIGMNQQELQTALANQKGVDRVVETKGGDITIKGDIVLATGGTVSFDASKEKADLSDAGTVDIGEAKFIQDGNGYYYVSAPKIGWEQALQEAKNGTAGLDNTWDTYLATIYNADNQKAAAIEDSVVSSVIPFATNGTQSNRNQVYIGGQATKWQEVKDAEGNVTGYTRDWKWVTGTEAANEDKGTTFYTTTVTGDTTSKRKPGQEGVTSESYGLYNNWKEGEPNSDSNKTNDRDRQQYLSVNYNNTDLTNAGDKPQSWDDLENNSKTASGYLVEVNLPKTEKFTVTASKLVVNPDFVDSTPLTPAEQTQVVRPATPLTPATQVAKPATALTPATQVAKPAAGLTPATQVAKPATGLTPATQYARPATGLTPATQYAKPVPEPAPVEGLETVQTAEAAQQPAGKDNGTRQQPGSTSNLEGTGSISQQQAKGMQNGVDRVLGLADGKLPAFRVADRRITNYGSYEIAATPDGVAMTAVAAKSQPRLPEAPADDRNYRQINRRLTTEKGSADFSLTYNGSTLNIYPQDKAARELIRSGETQQNIELLSKAIFTAQGSLGVDVADLDGVVLFTDVTEAEAGK